MYTDISLIQHIIYTFLINYILLITHFSPSYRNPPARRLGDDPYEERTSS